MQHTFYVLVWMSRSGYLKHDTREEKPDARYIGRIATHEHVIQVYTDELLTPGGKLAMIGRVARSMMSEGIIE